MDDQLNLLRRHIRQRGLRDTNQREEVLRFLASAKGHLSPDEIYFALKSRQSPVGRATVFRTLKLLEQCGLASKVTLANGTQKFESAHGRPHHDHLICVSCGDTIEFTNPAIEKQQSTTARTRGFRILWHRHEIFGHCAKCWSAAGKRGRSPKDRT